jgi:hypothetical protein
MPFTDNEIAEHTLTIEKHFWSKRRPPVEMRDQIREVQRFTGYTLDLFYVRPRWQHPGETLDSPVARVRYIKSRKLWQLYWMRADLKWHRYIPHPVTTNLEEALQVIDEDANSCFFG